MSISETELLPGHWGGVGERSIVTRLNHTLDKAEAMYASVAFWTIGPGYLSHRLQRLLAAPPSFCCVDLRGGSRLLRLLDFHRAGAVEMYLFLRKVAYSSDLALNRHLLHTKLLLFDMPGGKAELWVGSHNFTAYALGGGNREATAVLTISRRTKLYRQAKAYLHAIKAECQDFKFNPELFDQYKQLQGTNDDEPELACYVLPLFWNSQLLRGGSQGLADQAALLLTQDAETGSRLTHHFSNDRPLLVWAYDVGTGQPSYWSAEVLNAARISARTKASSAMRYDHLLVITVEHGRLPELRPRQQELGHDVLSQFRYSATVRLTVEVTDRYQLLPPPDPAAQARWVPDAAATDALRQLQQQEREMLGHLAWMPEEDYPFPFYPDDPRVERWEKRLERPGKTARRVQPADRGTARPPVVLRPLFKPTQPPEVHDPLTALARRLAPTAARQKLRQRLEKPLQADLFTPNLPAELTFLAQEAGAITLEKVLLRYHLLRK